MEGAGPVRRGFTPGSGSDGGLHHFRPWRRGTRRLIAPAITPRLGALTGRHGCDWNSCSSVCPLLGVLALSRLGLAALEARSLAEPRESLGPKFQSQPGRPVSAPRRGVMAGASSRRVDHARACAVLASAIAARAGREAPSHRSSPFHGVCLGCPRSFLPGPSQASNRPSGATKARPDTFEVSREPQTRSLQSFHSCSSSKPGHMLPCEKWGRPI